MSYDYNSWEPIKINPADLNDHETELLRDSKTFCMYPWIHLHAFPTGEAYPCCLAEMHHPVGNTKDNSIIEIANSEKMNSLRNDMINGVERPECGKCYEQEKFGFFSMRQSANKHFGHYIKRVHDTREDGSYPEFNITYLDIRFSNLCNLKCRSCGHIFSSQWHKDHIKLTQREYWNQIKDDLWPTHPPTKQSEFDELPETIQIELKEKYRGEIFKFMNMEKNIPVLNVAGRHESDMLEQVMDNIDSIEQIYWAGGEPLVMEEHYKILNEIIDRGRSDEVRLVYNSNFTKLNLKDIHVFDMWKKFRQVSVGASLDAMGKHAEYIRKGTKWKDVENNRLKMLKEVPHVDFYISPTLSIMNALHITDFHRDWVEKGFLKHQDININILQDPKFYRIDIAPEHYKDKIRDKFLKHIDWLKGNDDLNRATTGFESALKYLDNDNTQYLDKFWEKTALLDEIRNENILDSIPELNEITTR